MPVLYVINVNHGNSALLCTPNGNILIDAGPKNELLEFLISKNINEIDDVILSHSDADHIGGLMALIDSELIKIKNVYINSDSIKNSDLFDDLIYSLCNHSHIYLEPSITNNLNGRLDKDDVIVEILAPNKYLAVKAAGGKDRNGRHIDSNTISAVIRFIYKKDKIALFPGDIDLIGLDNLLADYTELNTQLLIFPHHGGLPGSTKIKEFVERICMASNPSVIIFSIKNNSKEFPHPEVLSNILSATKGTRMYTTNSSQSFIKFIQENNLPDCRDNVGTITIDFKIKPITLLFNN